MLMTLDGRMNLTYRFSIVCEPIELILVIKRGFVVLKSVIDFLKMESKSVLGWVRSDSLRGQKTSI